MEYFSGEGEHVRIQKKIFQRGGGGGGVATSVEFARGVRGIHLVIFIM